ncbi:hypothetical protein QFC22_002949 [Naganishia vaughanmartiniae]|uniref:Uncharacterized protein n=1 Tax=Naganishia vaughanmartiniae TaxID=1424756 RepID=A0ACC2X824_9TREE|nr:hypothetical protein QFC22_002949 [Naganishia vaughanmartiniae]
MSPAPSHVLPHALKLPIFKYLKDKRVVLASSSPRRKEVLEGLKPDIVPSTFPENLPHGSYSNAYAEYPIATAMEVYERLILKDEENAPELVISADTVIIFPPQTNADAIINNPSTISQSSNARLTGLNTDITSAEESEDLGEGERNGEGSRDELSWSGRRGGIARILEKPADKKDQALTYPVRQYKMLMELNGETCEVVTGVTIVYPTIAAPGFKLRSIAVSTLVEFNNNSPELIKAYVENGEGIDRAGGFAVQGLGGFLVKSIQGDYNNVVGFPSSPFWRWMGELYEDGVFSD